MNEFANRPVIIAAAIFLHLPPCADFAACLTISWRSATFTTCACVGGRGFIAEASTKQGTPVQFRDGPAAVTECVS
jgi:hypothetical protein